VAPLRWQELAPSGDVRGLAQLMTRVLVTGATGFVGHVLCETLTRAGFTVRAAVRTPRALVAGIAESVAVGDIGAATDWEAALLGVDCVIHAAARAHVLHGDPAGSDLYFETNERGTQSLADAAVRARVRRFVYLSSVKVNGEEASGKGYTSTDEPHPLDAYGISKWRAEQHLARLAALTGMETVIVRSPLVYGPRVRANFLRLMRWVDRGLPLPLAAVTNRRSLVSIWNLCDLLVHVLTHQSAPGRTWMVSDGEDLSTPELIRRIGSAMARRVRLIPVPVGLLQSFAHLLGRRAEIARLCGSLTVDITATRVALGWSPPVTLDSALARTVAWYLAEGRVRDI
jgi:nucleoside-diphosphate-sugar epimerase